MKDCTQINLVRYVPDALTAVIGKLQSYGPGVCIECGEAWQYIVLGHRFALYDYDQCRSAGIALLTDLPKWGADVVTECWYANDVELVRANTVGEPAHDYSTHRGCHAWLLAALWCVDTMAAEGKFDVLKAVQA